ncbi:MAG: tetratricopeptide repeat protein, partial [Bacteroidia bacterium]|nr:tetratricopeptide repeat protein [Bacteroidia bacterium]
MKILISLILLIKALAFTSYCQNSSFTSRQKELVDSLLQVTQTSRHDTIRARTYLQLGNLFLNTKPDTAIYFYTQALKIAEKIPAPKGIIHKANILNQLSQAYTKLGNSSQALNILLKAQRILELHIPTTPQVSSKSELQRLLALVLKSIGNNYQSVYFDYARALEYYFKALRISETLKLLSYQAILLQSISIVYGILNKPNKALDYLLKALAINQKLNNKAMVASNLGYIGNAYGALREWDKALEFFLKALQINKELNNKYNQANNLDNIGNLYFSMNQPEKAIIYFTQALAICQEIDDKSGVAYTLGGIGASYLQLKQYALAEKYLKEAIALSHQLGDIFQLKEDYQTLSDLLAQTNRYREALQAHKQYVLYKDSVFKEESQKATIQKEMQYHYEKEKAIREAEYQNRINLEKEIQARQKIV